MANEGNGARLVAQGALAAIAIITTATSYQHCLDVVESTGTVDWTRFSVPAVADLLVISSSLSMYDSAKRDLGRSRWAVAGMASGVLVTGGMNVTTGLGHGFWGVVLAAWVPLALFIAYEVLMSTLRKATPVAELPEGLCMHTQGGSVEESIKLAYLHGRDCLGKELSEQGLSDSFKAPLPVVQTIIRPLKMNKVAKATSEA